MPFSQLYDYCQTLHPKISRKIIRDKVLELTGIDRVSIVKTGLDPTICRGFYLSARNNNHRLVQQLGGCVIVLARDNLNYCWQRFVVVKELMHLFDDPISATDNGDRFEVMLREFSPVIERSQQGIAEIRCFYRALTALCPESDRLRYMDQKAKGQIDDYAIALELKIPEQYVPKLFMPDYGDMLRWLRAA
jgi:hypothetical protein